VSDVRAFALSSSQEAASHEAAANASQFLRKADHALGIAIVEYHWNDGPAADVVEALADFQNADGGFGNGLEVDIESPASNPFATRLAMIVLRDLHPGARTAMAAAIQEWLLANQAEDGDWHFSTDTRSGALAPWFEAWTFPSLNPSCCVAGLANALHIATPDMLAKVGRLFNDLASMDQARTGDFYTLLPYAEYAGNVGIADRDTWLDAIAANITSTAADGRYADAMHFWDHALGGGPPLVHRLPAEVLAAEVDRLLDEQEPDGGWPSPYSPAWRPFVTAQACVTLATLRKGI